MTRLWRSLLFGLALLVIAIQFVPVDRSHAPEVEIVAAPESVRRVLERSCFDCHSDRNRWPWYGYIAPFSWLIEYHMDEARDHLNFTAWDHYDEDERIELIEEAWDEVDLGKMPPDYYKLLHPSAELTQRDRELLQNWALNAE